MSLAAELEASLREFAAAGTAELRENGGRLAPLSRLSWEVRGAADRPLLHIWSEQYNLTRRVIAITDHSEARLALAVERFGRSRPDRLEFVRTDFERSARELSREEFCESLKQILAEQFPDETLESVTTSPDLEHSLSGNYARGVLRCGSAHIAFLAVPDGETQDTANTTLTFALLWLDHVRTTIRRGTTGTLRLIVPENAVNVIAHRFAALDRSVALELYQRDPARSSLEKIDPRRAGNLITWLFPCRESQALLAQAGALINPIVSLDPHLITAHPYAASREVLLRYRGLPLARWDNGRLFFSASHVSREMDLHNEITATSRPAFDRMLQELQLHRHPLATDTRHTLYRAQPERWLEAIVRNDVTRIDSILDSRFVYTQVFAGTGAEHGVIDVLAITRSGRLAILELKASEHIHLPLQAADYWLRIRRHLELKEFHAYGYFPSVEIQQAPPLVYLVAPAMRFHPATGNLLRHMSPEIEVVRVGLAESWRRGIRVMMRQ
ncbi:MAG: hypothetical protein M3N22_01645 [Acidobacteriota bacterium]|nr:hypothetical protein [Acidobacteriota bacterium]